MQIIYHCVSDTFRVSQNKMGCSDYENVMAMFDKKNIKRLIVFGKSPNTTFDYYITPRVRNIDQLKIKFVDPWNDDLELISGALENTVVLINRYVSFSALRWLKRVKVKLSGVIWLLDDDFGAMVLDSSVPLLNKAKPLQTILLQHQLKSIVDLLIVSTRKLSKKYQDWQNIVCAPVFDTSKVPIGKSINPKQIYYFAKMHGPEHQFLLPLIKQVLAEYSDVEFSVIGNKTNAKKWNELPRTTVLPEMHYNEYCKFLENLPQGGLFLVPLTGSRLNEGRSDSKLIDIVKSGSAAIFPSVEAYHEIIQHEKYVPFATSHEEWLGEIRRMIDDANLAKIVRENCKNFMLERYDTRCILF